LGIGLPAAVVITWITLHYRRRRRLIELHHAERMAAIERGMEIPDLPPEMLTGRPRRRRTSLLPGLVWFFVGLAVVVSRGSLEDAPLALGLVPLAIGLAYLIYYFVEGRKIEARQIEEEEMRGRNGRQGGGQISSSAGSSI